MPVAVSAELAGATLPCGPWRPGAYIGGAYVLRSLLGQGGMSSVWEAWDPALSRTVAIKIVDDPAVDDDLLCNEARALAAVRHVGLPAVHFLGKHHSRRFLVIERLYGETLETRLRVAGSSRVPLAEALRILVDLAAILRAVHDAGMAHHDVKPSNIMLCPEQRTVLLDFGIMVPEVDAAIAASNGTPGYLAPEVVFGQVGPGHARLVDVYAFGVVAFELLSGRQLFPGKHVASLLENHATLPAPDLGALRTDLPPDLVALVHACLAKSARERPSDMEAIGYELRHRLRQCERQPMGTPPASGSQRMWSLATGSGRVGTR